MGFVEERGYDESNCCFPVSCGHFKQVKMEWGHRRGDEKMGGPGRTGGADGRDPVDKRHVDWYDIVGRVWGRFRVGREGSGVEQEEI